jgi:hypothetical protein
LQKKSVSSANGIGWWLHELTIVDAALASSFSDS